MAPRGEVMGDGGEVLAPVMGPGGEMMVLLMAPQSGKRSLQRKGEGSTQWLQVGWDAPGQASDGLDKFWFQTGKWWFQAGRYWF